MARAPFNRTVTFRAGPGAAFPGVQRWQGQGRFVPQDGVFERQMQGADILGWVTFDTGQPVGPWVIGKFAVDPTLSDQVDIGDGTGFSWWVVYVEEIIWRGSTYWRAGISKLPLPNHCPCGPPPAPAGILIEGALTNKTCTTCAAIHPLFLPFFAANDWRVDHAACGGTFLYRAVYGTGTFTLTVTGPMGTSVSYQMASMPTTGSVLNRIFMDMGSACNWPATLTATYTP